MKAFVWRGLIVLLVGACSRSQSDGPLAPQADCPAQAQPGIVVTAIDSISGQPILAMALVEAEDESYVEKAVADPPQYFLAYDREGDYVVTVQLAGYQPWHADDVMVQSDQCHVVTEFLTAQLVR